MEEGRSKRVKGNIATNFCLDFIAPLFCLCQNSIYRLCQYNEELLAWTEIYSLGFPDWLKYSGIFKFQILNMLSKSTFFCNGPPTYKWVSYIGSKKYLNSFGCPRISRTNFLINSRTDQTNIQINLDAQQITEQLSDMFLSEERQHIIV